MRDERRARDGRWGGTAGVAARLGVGALAFAFLGVLTDGRRSRTEETDGEATSVVETTSAMLPAAASEAWRLDAGSRSRTELTPEGPREVSPPDLFDMGMHHPPEP